MSATGADPATVRNWLADLSFAEAHAMTYGWVHGAGTVACYWLGVVGGFGLLRDTALALFLTFLVLNGWCTTNKTEGFPLVSNIIESLPAGITGQIRAEQHYYAALYVVGAVVMYGVALLLGGF